MQTRRKTHWLEILVVLLCLLALALVPPGCRMLREAVRAQVGARP